MLLFAFWDDRIQTQLVKIHLAQSLGPVFHSWEILWKLFYGCKSDISIFVKEGTSWRMHLVIIYAAPQAKVHLNCDTLEESGKYLINYVGSKGERNYLMCLEAIC